MTEIPDVFTPWSKSGCTVCGTQDTATVDGIHGRRCADHPPTFDPHHAVTVALKLGPEAAFTYCRTEGLA